MKEDIIFKLTELAIDSILYEVSCYPSFGLVSPISTGAHDDMNYFTFIDSSTLLYRYFLKMTERAYSSDSIEMIFSDCRKIGMRAEEEMLKKTKGVNTHKGMIFVMGIGLIAISKLLYDGKSLEDLSEFIKAMTNGLVDNELKRLERKSKLTNGEKIYLKYGISGIRGEVEDGLPIVLEKALPYYENLNGKGENKKLLKTLLLIMSECDDTTILNRHSLEVLEEVKKDSKKLLEISCEKSFYSSLSELDEKHERKRISPGGCADLLAVTIFISKVKKENLF